MTARSMGEVIGNIRRFAELSVWDGELPETFADAEVQEASEDEQEGQPTVSVEGVLSQIRWDYARQSLDTPDLSELDEQDRIRLEGRYETLRRTITAAQGYAEESVEQIDNLQEFASLQALNRNAILQTIEAISGRFI